jgi:hypothetical protein
MTPVDLEQHAQNMQPFGGKVVVLGVDFHEILPVERRASRARIISLTIKNSELWSRMIQFQLHTNMRLTNNSDREWDELLLRAVERTEFIDENGCISLLDD